MSRPRSAAAHRAILEAAVEELAERSFSGMTIERVAARAGVARTTVYRRWSSLAQLCMDAVETLRDPLPVPPGGPVPDDLVALLQDLRHLLTESRLGRLLPHLTVEASRHPDLSLTYWNDYLGRESGPFAAVLRRGVDEGLVRPDLDVLLAVDLLTGPLFKRATWQLPTSDEDLRALVEVVLRGLAPVEAPAG